MGFEKAERRCCFLLFLVFIVWGKSNSRAISKVTFISHFYIILTTVFLKYFVGSKNIADNHVAMYQM